MKTEHHCRENRLKTPRKKNKHLNTVQMAAWKACKVLPLSVPDLALCHRGTIQGQRPLLQHSHRGRRGLFNRNREMGVSVARWGAVGQGEPTWTITEMCVFVFPTPEKTFPSHCWHVTVSVTSVSAWAASYRGQISWGCTGLQLSRPSSAQWRKSSPCTLQGHCAKHKETTLLDFSQKYFLRYCHILLLLISFCSHKNTSF